MDRRQSPGGGGGGGGWWCWRRRRWMEVVVEVGCVLMMLTLPVARGVIMCECSTEECLSEGKRTCYAAHYCYSEYFKDTLSRGCIDEGSSLLCENRKPKGIDYWPSLFCCNDHDYCNKDVTPSLPLDTSDEKNKDQHKAEGAGEEEVRSGGKPAGRPDGGDPPLHPVPEFPAPVPCQKGEGEGSGLHDDPTHSSGSKVINPIYIAVPVAGVCVLLALIIFAMYLLRRRNHHHHYDNYHHYHDHLHPGQIPPHHHHHHLHHPSALAKQGSGEGGRGAGGGGGGGGGGSSGGGGGGVGGVGGGNSSSSSGSGGGGGGGGGGVPLYHHHCDCVCQKSLPPCGGKVNRCTDSERSSSGSETKLFLQA